VGIAVAIVVIAVAIMVIFGVVVAIVLAQGRGAKDDGMTPVMAMTHERSAPGDFNFTVVGITSNDVRWSDTQLEIFPLGEYALTLPSTAAYIKSGDVIGITNLTLGTTYVITLKYIPTGSAICQIAFLAD
jgi:hypothetical protein